MKNKRLQDLLSALAPAPLAASAEAENLDQQLLAKIKGGITDTIDETEYPPQPVMRDHGCSPRA